MLAAVMRLVDILLRVYDARGALELRPPEMRYCGTQHPTTAFEDNEDILLDAHRVARG